MDTYVVLPRRQVYWLCQLGGWMLYIFLNGIFLYLNGKLDGSIVFGLVLVFISGILLTQLLRFIILRGNWLLLPLVNVLPRVLGMNVLMGGIVAFIQNMNGDHPFVFEAVRFSVNVLNFTFVFFFWSVIYFLVHFLVNFRKAEIEALRWKASIHEAELNRLKSQLNPHFMFNAMNSIRALVDENPARAKEAVTQLSNLLRNTLQMGKRKTIAFDEEMALVRDYIAIESTRLEERLEVEWKIDPSCSKTEIPPLMIQTLVENGIKHGISKIPGGGLLSVEAACRENGVDIFIRNTGHFEVPAETGKGLGLENTNERLKLLYAGRAEFSIENVNGNTVKAHLFIPKQTEA